MPQEATRPGCDLETFRDVMGHFASGVTIVTARERDQRYGMTASAVSSLSLEPPMLLVCINRAAPTCSAVGATGRFGVNILSEHQGDVAERFARPSDDKFERVDVTDGTGGVPMLAEALAQLECRVVESVAGGTHYVFLAEVERAQAGEGSPLAYFRGRFGRLDLAADEAVYAGLRQRVLNGDIDPAEPLDAAGLAGALGCERWHVFHALTKLVADGLVAWDPGRGYVVEPVDAHAVRDALDARCVIELGVADLCIGSVAADDLSELRRRMEATLPLIVAGRFTDVDRYAAANADFHEYMVGLADSRVLVDAYRRLSIPGIMARTLRRSDLAEEGLRDDHRQLVDAYERGDLALAKAAITRHVERAKRVHQVERTAWKS